MVLVASSLSWTTFGIAVGGAALAAVALLVLAIWLLRRRPQTDQIELMLRESSTRVEAMISDLTNALDHAQEETARSRQLAEIASSIDLDEVLARTLEAAGALLGVDGSMVVLDDGQAPPMIASIGLSAEEISDPKGPVGIDWAHLRAAVITYLYPPEQGTADPIRGSMALPIRNEGGAAIGTLWAFWRGSETEPSKDRVELLEELASRAGPAIENARRFQEARQLADLDALTGLHNYRYFHETLAREVARAHRYDRRLALVVFDLDDFKSVNDRIGHLAGDTVLAEAAARVRSVVRGADIACRVGGDEFAVILPESTRDDAESLYRRLEAAMNGWRSAGEQLRLSAGIAEMQEGDDATAFFKRADEALYRAKQGGKGQAITAASGS
jgi:diguanylate cyclase (GGDEF)-like protein